MKRMKNGSAQRTYAVRPIHVQRRRTSVRSILITAAVCVMCLCVAGGTLAWITAETDPVVNTFTYGKIAITLTETEREYKIMPGKTLPKDPVLTVVEKSEDCWLFIKIDKSANLDDFIEFELADGWTALNGADGVYYRQVSYSAAAQEFHVLKDDKVTVPTDADTNSLVNAAAPTLTFTGYAVQRDMEQAAIDTAAEAWTLISQRINP